MTTSELNDFWNAKEIKIWVVTLYGVGKNNKTDVKIVRASAEQKALSCAKNNSTHFYNKRCTGFARYADPVTDLHCIRVEVSKQ